MYESRGGKKKLKRRQGCHEFHPVQMDSGRTGKDEEKR